MIVCIIAWRLIAINNPCVKVLFTCKINLVVLLLESINSL